MTEIKTWITSIISVVILTVIIELILPDNSNKKYINLVLSMIITITLVTPVINIICNGKSIEVSKIMESIDIVTNNDISEFDNKKQEEYIISKSKQGIEDNIKKFLVDKFNDKYEIENVNVNLNEKYEIEKINIDICKKENKDVNIKNEEITSLVESISINYEIDKKIISVKVKER